MDNVCGNLRGNLHSSIKLLESQVNKSGQNLNITHSNTFSGYEISPWAQDICTGKADIEPDPSSEWHP
jgi:hypothetical protein